MYVLWIGVLMVGLKLAEIGPFATLDWLYVLAPLGVAFLWFEVFEKMFGRDKRNVEHVAYEKARKDRVKAQFEQHNPKRKAKA